MIKAIAMMLVEVAKALLLKVAWKAVVERFATRLVVWGLTKLSSMTSNTLDDAAATDIINSLQGKKLKVIDDTVAKKSQPKSDNGSWSE